MKKIPLIYFQQEDVVALSRQLIGKYLFTCCEPENVITGGMIIETEAYRGPEDKASHAYNNRRTKRTETMFSVGGVAYVYLCYGLHNLFNIVTNKQDIPHAILIRAIKPEVGIDVMLKRRNQKSLKSNLTNGPGSVCQALGITREYDGIPLNGKQIWLEDRGINIRSDYLQESPRIGVDYAGEDAMNPWRFSLIQS